MGHPAHLAGCPRLGHRDRSGARNRDDSHVWLGLGVWDYSGMLLNYKGQICLPFSILWIFVSIAAVVLDDWLRYWLFGEERPHYTLFRRGESR